MGMIRINSVGTFERSGFSELALDGIDFFRVVSCHSWIIIKTTTKETPARD